jgi:hypothetical protein
VPSPLQILQALEVELHHPDVRRNPARLAQLLHREFHEVGRSGRMYNRESIMELLATQDSQFEVVSDNYTVSELGAEMALLTYRSAHIDQSNNLVNHTLRSSVWLKTNAAGWQLRYHQGTAAAEKW